MPASSSVPCSQRSAWSSAVSSARSIVCVTPFKIEVATTSPVVALTTLHEAKLSTGCLSLLHEPSKKRCCIPSWGGGTKKKLLSSSGWQRRLRQWTMHSSRGTSRWCTVQLGSSMLSGCHWGIESRTCWKRGHTNQCALSSSQLHSVQNAMCSGSYFAFSELVINAPECRAERRARFSASMDALSNLVRYPSMPHSPCMVLWRVCAATNWSHASSSCVSSVLWSRSIKFQQFYTGIIMKNTTFIYIYIYIYTYIILY